MGIRESISVNRSGDSCAVCGTQTCTCKPPRQGTLPAAEPTPTPMGKLCRWCNKSPCSCKGIDRSSRANDEQQEQSLLGQVVGQQYEVLEVIGRGGMGTVYKVRHRNLKHLYALKMIHHKRGITKKTLKRFDLEAKAASVLNHLNLVKIFDYGSAVQGPYIVMELAAGRPLFDYIHFQQLLSESVALDVFIQLCDGLMHAHSKRVLHRDIKPGNIMIDESSGKVVARLLDFGVAKLMPEDEGSADRLTQTGEVVGSPKYMSPEQCLGNKQDARSDIYSLGCVMFEALTGKSPFDGENAVQIYFSQINERAPSFRTVAPNIFIRPELERVVLQCLEKSPDHRYQTVDELRGDLLLLKAGKNPSLKRTYALRRNLRIVAITVVWLMSIAALSIGSALGYDWYQNNTKPAWTKSAEEASAFLAQGREFYPQAELAYKKAQATALRAQTGPADQEWLLYLIAHLYNETDRPAEALKALKDAMEYSRLQATDPNRGKLYDETAKAYMLQKNWTQALEAATSALEAKGYSVNSVDTEKVAKALDIESSLSRKGIIQQNIGDNVAAEKTFEEDLNICTKVYPSTPDLRVANAAKHLAQASAKSPNLKSDGDVEIHANKALYIYKTLLGPQHPLTQEHAKWYVDWLRSVHSDARVHDLITEFSLNN